jgi:tetratricopeptide (TPR) repeat protein
MATAWLDRVNWEEALDAAQRREGLSPLLLRDLQSLSGLFATDYVTGAARICEARDADSLNPIHALRLALFNLRFGQWSVAAAQCQALQEALPGVVLPSYVRGLASLRQDEPSRAANIAQSIIDARPGHGPANFLRVEARLRTVPKSARKEFPRLPRGPAHAPAWADLLIKLAVSGSEDGRKMAAQALADQKALPPASKERALVGLVLQLQSAAPEQFEASLAGVKPGSRAEEMLVLLAFDRFADNAALEGIRRLGERFPDRPALRHLSVCLLSRRATQDAAEERFSDARRLVERCQRLEPHQTAHYQNLAALFTLTREHEAYHQAWFELNRHHYRLALLGQMSTADALQLAKPHALFAEQARLNTSKAGSARDDQGLFAEKERQRDSGPDMVQEVNQDRIDADPELLRQWVHHRRAELFFRHLALGWSPARFLLYPQGPPQARERCKGLVLGAKSLATLVSEEGAMLAARVTARWEELAQAVPAAYGPQPADAEANALRQMYVQTLGDLAVLCLNWKPNGKRPDLVEDVLELLDAAAPFFDEQALLAPYKEPGAKVPYGTRVLAGHLERTLGLEGEDYVLTQQQREKVIERLAANLLNRQAYRSYNVGGTGNAPLDAAMALAERARTLAPDDIEHQLTSARFLLLGGNYDDARRLLLSASRLPDAREPDRAEEIEELRKLLGDRKGTTGHSPADGPTGQVGPAAALEDVEREIEQSPTSIRPYEDLVRGLASEGRFGEAADWAERAVTRCLARDSQFRARSLHLEVAGLELLAGRGQELVRFYLVGVHRPALEVIESGPSGEGRPYPLSFLQGHCLLALNEPEQARERFEEALYQCDRQMHRAVLRRLASDVDEAYLSVARRGILDHLRLGAFEEALRAAAEATARLKCPEAGFLDLARVHYEAAAARLGKGHPPLGRPEALTRPSWAGALDEAYDAATDVERARRLARLARTGAPARQVEMLENKIAALGEQEATASALVASGELLRQGRHQEALEALDGPALEREPRAQRQRAMLLLVLERFDEAEAIAEQLARVPTSAEFVASFPRQAFRQRMVAAARLIRAGSEDKASRILDGAAAKTPEEVVELAYCRAFCRAMGGYRLRRQGQQADARRAFLATLAELERNLGAARAAGHAQFLELLTKLEAEVGSETWD